MYTRGDLVEVCSKESGLVGSYNEASIVSHELRKDLFIVIRRGCKDSTLVETVRLDNSDRRMMRKSLSNLIWWMLFN
ncbi:hypothetical protein F8388_014145 [Cannabis sativa]|uniref:Agenet-like domain-containing protein n=1 Tax=Cannabis sativa TaxID=3483 RepID=A0A7J6GL61_CANSA|nr:hypothetical protein F8388_014145 [Cannabis sativa]